MTLQEFLKVADISDIYLVLDNITDDWFFVYALNNEAKEAIISRTNTDTLEVEDTKIDPTRLEVLKIKVIEPNNSVLLLVKDI